METLSSLLDEGAMNQIAGLVETVFHLNPLEPVLGTTDDVVIAPTLTNFRHPDTVLATLREDERIIGFSATIPIGIMDPTRQDESTETAYVYFVAIDPSRQGQGLVVSLQEEMGNRIRERGYTYVEGDALIASGYADMVTKAFSGSIVETREHAGFTGTGPERFVRIRIRPQ